MLDALRNVLNSKAGEVQQGHVDVDEIDLEILTKNVKRRRTTTSDRPFGRKKTVVQLHEIDEEEGFDQGQEGMYIFII